MLTEIAEGIAKASVARGLVIAANLRDTGIALAGALLVWFLVWRALRLATDAQDSLAEFFGDLVLKVSLAAVVYWLLEASIYAALIQEWIWNGLRDVATRAAGTSSAVPGTTALAALELSLDQFRDGVIGALIKVNDSLGSGTNPVTWLASLVRDTLATLVVAGIVVVILAVAKALAVGAFCVGAVMFGVGAGLGPLFVPLLLHDRLENYFWAWLRFLIVSAATLVVGVIVVLLLADSLRAIMAPGGIVANELGQLVQAQSLSNLDFLTVAAKAVVVALFVAYVLAQVPEITNALFSGSTAGIRSGAGAALRAIVRGGRTVSSNIARRVAQSNRDGPDPTQRPGGRSDPSSTDSSRRPFARRWLDPSPRQPDPPPRRPPPDDTA